MCRKVEKPCCCRFPDSPDEAAVCQKYAEMTTLLDQFESRIYSEWRRNVDKTCEFNLNQPLVKFSPINGLLSVNFDPKVGLCLSKCIKDAAPLSLKLPLMTVEFTSVI